MSFAERLAEGLKRRAASPQRPDLAIIDWRVLVDTSTSADVGLKDGHLGGPYDAPNQVTGTRGEAYVVWADGRISSGTIDRTTLENLDEDLALWREAAYRDEFAPEVLGPQTAPDVPIYDAGVALMATEDQGALFALLDRFMRELPPYEAARVSGTATASVTQRRLLSSRGLDHTSAGTSFGAFADADHRAYDVLSLRRPPRPEEVDRLIRTVGESNRLLRREATLRAGAQPIVFMPSAAESMLSKFVLGNLDGQRVVNGQSAWGLEAFTEGREVFEGHFGLAVDPLTPMSPGSYALTREGVPARRFDLIREGRLVTPLLDLKHAKISGLAPTPFPRGASSLRLAGPTQSLESLVAGLERGLVVYQLLGVHTQDTASGAFSLTVTQGLVVEDGKLVGRAKALIAGNFLKALAAGVALGSVPGKDVPALMIRADVTAG